MKARRKFYQRRIRNRWAVLLTTCMAVPALSAAEADSTPAGAADAAPAEPAKEAAAAAAPAGETVAEAKDAAEAEKPAAEEKAGEEAKETAEKDATEAGESAAALTPEQMFEGGDQAYKNWVEIGTGGFITSGDRGEFSRRHQRSNGAFGGIEDLHFQQEVAKGTTLTVDGRAMFDEEDYKLSLGVVKEKLGYIRFSYTEYQTYYNGDGGYFPPSDRYYSFSDDPLSLDNGEITFEAGLRMEKKPQVTFRYTHKFQDGDKDSTIWGPAHPDGTILLRGIAPALTTIDESSDSFELDVAHKIKQTAFGLGLRYETGELENTRKIFQFPGEAVEQKITNREGTSYDLFNVHAFTETWIKKNLLFSSGFSFTDLDNDFSGSRVYGSDFDVSYAPNAQAGFGYYGLDGGSQLHEYTLDLNLMIQPLTHLTIVPSVRVLKEDMDADSTGIATLSDRGTAPFSAESERDVLDVRERIEVRYTGVTNWVFYARPEWTQGDGNLEERGGLVPIGGIGTSPVDRETEDSRFFQKYAGGLRWYPDRRFSVNGEFYYKLNEYEYDHERDNTANNSFNRYPAYLVMQDFETYDANAGFSWRPWRKLSLGTRYEYQVSTIDTRPDRLSGLDEIQTSEMTSHIFSQDITYTPWSRLYLQAGFNYVVSETETPASEVTQAILDAQNNYWTLNFSTGFVLNDRTDLRLGYFYYQADNYEDNSSAGLPLGIGEDEHGVTATLTRRINKNLRLTLRYGYYNLEEESFGGNRDYQSHVVYSSLQYRF